jgi:hypothetical protein
MAGSDGENRFRTLRRTVLGALGSLGALAVIPKSSRGMAETGSESSAPTVRQRVMNELRTRTRLARADLGSGGEFPPHDSNDRLSERAVVSKFGKSLQHDDHTGLPTVAAYESLVRACETGEGFGEIEQQSFDLDDDGDGILQEIVPSDVIDDEAGLRPKPLVQPETAWTYLPEGKSTAQLRIAVPPAFDSAAVGAEMVELYWRALTRDIPFHEYKRDEHQDIRDAASELHGMAGYRGPGSEVDPNSDRLDGSNLFRGVTPGAQTGPYVSQFLLQDLELGGGTVEQRLEPQVAETTPRDYMTDVEDWLKVQKGVVPATDDNLPGNEYADERRYILTGRDLCERVHDDPPFRQLQKAAQVLIFTMQAPLDEAIPYTLKPFETSEPLESPFLEGNDDPNARNTPSRRDVDRFLSQTTLPFNDFGPLYIEKKVIEASEHGQKAAWHKKWDVHRRLRPEEYGGRIEAALSSTLDDPVDYPIPDNLRYSDALEETKERFGSYFLPQAYAEGSPTHPSYPAGHSVVAGAGATVLKALFDGDYKLAANEKVAPNEDGSDLLVAADVSDSNVIARDHDLFAALTVNGELNKLASNMALGRNRAGIHYRSDGIEGLRLGERAAIQFLEDQLALPSRIGSVSLSLETFDGTERTVEPTTDR